MAADSTPEQPLFDAPGAAPGTDTLVRPDVRTQTRTRHQPPYAVIIENDEKHTFDYVIEVLQKVCGHNLEKAFVLTHEIHHTGRAHVWSGTLEVAELKRDQIRGYGPDFYASLPVRFPLGVTIEPLPSD